MQLSKSPIQISEAEETIIITAKIDVTSKAEVIILLEYRGFGENHQDFKTPSSIIILTGKLENKINFVSIDNSILNFRKKIAISVSEVINVDLYDANVITQYVYLLGDVDPIIGFWTILKPTFMEKLILLLTLLH